MMIMSVESKQESSHLESLDEFEGDNDAKNSSNTSSNSKDINSQKMNMYDHGNKIIRLNVGGVKYTTRISTLTSFHQQSPHALGAMFSGQYLLKPDINDNEYFIDRDGEYFKYILCILRDGPEVFINDILPILAADKIVFLKQEAKYFGLYSMIFGDDNQIYIDKQPSPTPILWKPKWIYDGMCKRDFIVNRGLTNITTYPIPTQLSTQTGYFYTEFALSPIVRANKCQYSTIESNGVWRCNICLFETCHEPCKRWSCAANISTFVQTIDHDKNKKNQQTNDTFKVIINISAGYMEIYNCTIQKTLGGAKTCIFENIDTKNMLALGQKRLRLEIAIGFLKKNRCLKFEA